MALLRTRTPLHMAAGKGHVDIAKFLIDRGADFMNVDICGVSVMDACKRGIRNLELKQEIFDYIVKKIPGEKTDYDFYY